MNVKVKILYTPNQIKKMKKHHKKGESVSIRLSNHQLMVDNGTDTEVSPEVFKKIMSAKKGGRGYVMVLKQDQIGGLLPALIPILTALAPALLSGVATSASGFLTKKVLDSVFPDKPSKKEKEQKGKGLVRAGSKRGQGLRLAGSGKKKEPKMKK